MYSVTKKTGRHPQTVEREFLLEAFHAGEHPGAKCSGYLRGAVSPAVDCCCSSLPRTRTLLNCAPHCDFFPNQDKDLQWFPACVNPRGRTALATRIRKCHLHEMPGQDLVVVADAYRRHERVGGKQVKLSRYACRLLPHTHSLFPRRMEHARTCRRRGAPMTVGISSGVSVRRTFRLMRSPLIHSQRIYTTTPPVRGGLAPECRETHRDGKSGRSPGVLCFRFWDSDR